MKLIWTRKASADRDTIYDYIEAHNSRAALELDEQFAHRAAQLLAHPLMGRPGRVQGTRELIVRTNYVLVYDISGETLRILRLLHAARQWPKPSSQDA